MAAEGGSLRDEVAQLRQDAETIRESVARMGGDTNTNRNTNIVNGGAVGVWIAVTCCLVMLVAFMALGSRVTDLRADMHAERGSRERMDNWTAQEVTAIRSYITNGRLQPMTPRPTNNEEPQK